MSGSGVGSNAGSAVRVPAPGVPTVTGASVGCWVVYESNKAE